VLDDTSVLAQCLIDRQHALDTLKTFSLSAEDESVRGALRSRIESILSRDAEAMQLLREAKDSVAEQLGQLVHGRALVRSYGGQRDSVPSLVRRMG
jgi:hypothetical protein